MPQGDIYILKNSATVSTAITVLQLKAGANNGFEIVRAQANQRGSTTSVETSARVWVLRAWCSKRT